MLKWLLLGCIIFNLTSNSADGLGNKTPTAKLAPCRICKVLVESFKKGLERTSKYAFEGGDTAWEEEKLGSYSTSEIRFVEIQENLCSEVEVGKEQCYNVLEDYEPKVEEWWFKKQSEEPDLHKFLCIDGYQVCCPQQHFGKDCAPCQGFPDNVCHNNGKCKGSGTRKGDGKCHCDKGYGGDHCGECAEGYYKSYEDDKKFLCTECYAGCDGPCTEGSSKGCSKCKPGWVFEQDVGCVDINECVTKRNPCTPLQFCVNNEGSYRCLDCDQSCAGCTGDGPDMCVNCALGYYKKDNLCVDTTEENRKNFVSFSRYLTYMGLCIASCIIFNKNTYLAAIVGSCVAIYISVSEYYIHYGPTPKSDMESQVVEQVMKHFNN